MKQPVLICAFAVAIAGGYLAGRHSSSVRNSPGYADAPKGSSYDGLPVPEKKPGVQPAGLPSLDKVLALARSNGHSALAVAEIIPVIDGWNAGQLKDAAAAILKEPRRWHNWSDTVLRQIILEKLAEADAD